MKTWKKILMGAAAFLAVVLSSVFSYDKITFSKRIYGIDVSHHNGEINWSRVASDNKDIQFVYIKATEGKTFQDPLFHKNVTEASKAGLRTGAYHYFTMKSSPEDQFINFRRTVKKHDGILSLRPVIDIEEHKPATVAELRKAVDTYVSLCYNEYGSYPVIYSSPVVYKYWLSDFVKDNCPLWLGSTRIVPGLRCAIWQKGKTKIDGINHIVDFNEVQSGYQL